MTPEDLPTTDGYMWLQWAGDFWLVPKSKPTDSALAVLVSRRLIIPGGPELLTPADVRAYYDARPHVPCPFRFEP